MKTELSVPSLEQIVNFFKEETIDQIAKEIGFSVRKRKLSAIVFLGIFTLGLIQKANATLVQLISIAKRILPSLNISPQGLHKRINQSAVDFLMRMFAISLSLSIDKDEKLVPLKEKVERGKRKVWTPYFDFVRFPVAQDSILVSNEGANLESWATIVFQFECNKVKLLSTFLFPLSKGAAAPKQVPKFN